MWGHKTRASNEARFWSRVDKNGPKCRNLGRCWQWTGCLNRNGYGLFNLKAKKQTPAHRVAYEMVKGSIPEGLFILHKCDNPKCVRPSHLYAGTQQDNVQDAVNRRRFPSANRSPHAKLNFEKAAQIRIMYKSKSHTLEQIGKMFGICGSHALAVGRGDYWNTNNNSR